MGHGRLTGGEHAYRQLDELYRALHWYVNCFQPSMKLVSKQVEGRKIHRIYDAAKTPLQRVLSSGVLPTPSNRNCVPSRKRLTRFGSSSKWNSCSRPPFAVKLIASQSANRHRPRRWSRLISQDAQRSWSLQEAREADELPQEEQKSAGVLDWRRTSKDPFAGQWEQILTWVRANPTRSSGDILRELQSLFPGRYERSHLRTLQRGIRKIRTQVLQEHEEAGSPQGPEGNLLASAELKTPRPKQRV